MSTYPGECGGRGWERCEYLPGGVWRKGPGRDMSTYLGECGGRGWGET